MGYLSAEARNSQATYCCTAGLAHLFKKAPEAKEVAISEVRKRLANVFLFLLHREPEGNSGSVLAQKEVCFVC